MRILLKAVTPDGIGIQIEEWSEDYSFFAYGDTVAAYPIFYGRLVRPRPSEPKYGEKHRVELRFDSLSESEAAFSKLESGEHKLSNYRDNIVDPRYREYV